MAAMLSGSSIALAKVSHKKAVKALQTEQGWAYNGSGDPTMPSNYTSFPDIETSCQEQAELCGISAPAAANGQPDINAVSGLNDALQNNQPHPNKFLGPRNE